jgi:hypothetical protein
VLSSNVVIPYYYPRLLFHVITPLWSSHMLSSHVNI